MAKLSGGPSATVARERSGNERRSGLRAVLLDVDGTLVDSNDAHAAAWEEALRAEGHEEATFERIRPLIGMGSDQLLPRLGIDPKSPGGRALAEEREGCARGGGLHPR
ncbi:MAG: HAD family hydrolase [Myxococcales bacterium]|nr:HAD family hydrolase [Myxococcales bacterium]